MKSLNNQHGAFLMLSSLVLVVVLLIVQQVLNTSLSQLNAEVGRQKRIAQGYIALRDFALMTQRAYEISITNAGACPAASTIADSLGRPFCWPRNNAPIAQRCIRHPASTGTTRMLCLGGTQPNVIQVTELQSPTQRFFAQAKGYAADLIAKASEILRQAQSVANAQNTTIEAYLPDITAPPTNRLTAAMGCTNGTPASTYCKRCTDGPQPRNLNCVTLQICLAERGCAGALSGNWITQGIGVGSR